MKASAYRTGRHVYFAQDATDVRRLVKIGASNDPPLRVRDLSNQIGRPVHLLGVLHDEWHCGERRVHARWAACRALGAGDLPTTEWFDPTPDLMAYIAEHAMEYRPPPRRTPPDLGDTWLGRFVRLGSEPWVTPEEAAAFLGCSTKTIRRWARERAVPHVRPGGSVRIARFKITDLAAWQRQRARDSA